MHHFEFITRIYHDLRSSECQIKIDLVFCDLNDILQPLF